MDKVKEISKKEVVVFAEKGNTIKLIFKEDDDLETEESITLSLLNSYEERMKRLNNHEM